MKSFQIHIGKVSGLVSGDFPDTFSSGTLIERVHGITVRRVGAPRHDITANLLSYLIKIFEFKADWVENPGIGYWKKFPKKSVSHESSGFACMGWSKIYQILKLTGNCKFEYLTDRLGYWFHQGRCSVINNEVWLCFQSHDKDACKTWRKDKPRKSLKPIETGKRGVSNFSAKSIRKRFIMYKETQI